MHCFCGALHFLAAGGSPTGLVDLASASDAEGIGGNVVGNNGAGGDIGTIADAHGRNESRVAADEDAAADDGGVLRKCRRNCR